MRKNPAAVALGRKGGKATAQNRTAEERSEAARRAVQARWEKDLAQLEKKIAARPRKAKQEKPAR